MRARIGWFIFAVLLAVIAVRLAVLGLTGSPYGTYAWLVLLLDMFDIWPFLAIVRALVTTMVAVCALILCLPLLAAGFLELVRNRLEPQ